jgi:hypothetical protein
MTASKTTRKMGERITRKTKNKSRLSDWLWGIGILAIPMLLALVFGFSYFSWYMPLTPDQLTEMTGTVKKWELERQLSTQRGLNFSRTTTDLNIYTVEHDRYFRVRSNYYDKRNCFDADGFKRDIKEGDVLTFMVLKEDVQTMRFLDVHGLASKKRVYLSVDSARAYDVENHKMNLYVFIGSLICLAVLIPVARLFFITKMKTKKAANQGSPS